ncbi:MAG: hypothetical protein H3C41_06930 [Bacteroidales bacterium]|nr:hypothetical protein [Bacteroidales bacterium]
MNTFVKIILFFGTINFSVFAYSQSDSTLTDLSASRNKTVQHILDYRFRGGAGEFERLLLQQVKYTPEALSQCVMGTVILSFTVDCDNNMSEMRVRNPMYHGLNEQLQAFYKSTEGMWNRCNDRRYSRFEIPVLFKIEKVETHAGGLFEIEGNSPGVPCRGDDYYFEQYKKNQAKGKTKKALQALDVLIHRDPYNQEYYDLKKNLLLGKEETP